MRFEIDLEKVFIIKLLTVKFLVVFNDSSNYFDGFHRTAKFKTETVFTI